ncbi:T9SS type A sorting domain-containing protein [bacterium]|nr:T9SS type A sorting domain-containing protein [bacterium]
MGKKYLQIITASLPAFILVLLAQNVRADIVGAEMSYSLIDDTLHISLTTFDDYSSSVNFSKYVAVESASSTKVNAQLKKFSQTDITPICNSACTNYSSSGCNNPFTLVKTVYKSTILLSEFSITDCDIKLSWSNCCRPDTKDDYYLEVKLNKCIEGGNTSAKIVNDPYPMAAYNEAYSYSWNATDADGDSLVYEMVAAKTGPNGEYKYEKGLDYQTPLYYLGYPQKSSTFPKGFHFDNNTGMLRFYPAKLGTAPVAVKISEYRDGVKIGESMREITYKVQSFTNNRPVVTGINGGFKESINACVGQKLCFTIQTEDNNVSDNVDVSWHSTVPNATINKTTGKRPSVEFCWTPGKNDINKTYQLVVSAEDNSCEYTGKSERIIEIKAVSPFQVSFTYHVSGCQEITMDGTTNAKNDNKFKYVWQTNNTEFFGKSISVQFDNSGNQAATLLVVNETTGCSNEYKANVQVPALPKLQLNVPAKICANSSATLSASGAGSYTWFDMENNPLGSKNKLDITPTENTWYKVKAEDKYNCVVWDSVQVGVVEPNIKASIENTLVCKGAPFEVTATDVQGVVWSKAGLLKEKNQVATYSLLRSETITLSGIDENGCSGSFDIAVKVDQDCVWPGDINGDDEVNNHDVLMLGVAYGQTNLENDGSAPFKASWTPYVSKDWPQSFANNRNYKHADVNHDGIIDYNDLMVIDRFYTRQVVYNHKKNSNGVKLYFKYDVDSMKDKKYVTIDVMLGTESEPAKDVYGIAFTIEYNKTVDTSSIGFVTDNSWMAKGSSTLKLVKNIPSKGTDGGGKIDIAFTRINQSTVSGHGKVGSVKFVVEDVIDWKKITAIELLLESVDLVDGNGKNMDAYGESASINLNEIFSGIDYQNHITDIKAYPNPVAAGGNLFVTIDETITNASISLMSMTGQQVYLNNNAHGGLNQIPVGALTGCYILVVETEQGQTTVPIIIR